MLFPAVLGHNLYSQSIFYYIINARRRNLDRAHFSSISLFQSISALSCDTFVAFLCVQVITSMSTIVSTMSFRSLALAFLATTATAIPTALSSPSNYTSISATTTHSSSHASFHIVDSDDPPPGFPKPEDDLFGRNGTNSTEVVKRVRLTIHFE